MASLLPVLVAALGLSLPGLLHDDKLPGWINGLIAFAVILVCSYLEALTGGKLTGHFNEDVGLFVIIASSLLMGPLRPLVEYLQKVPVLSTLLDFMSQKKELPPRG